MWLDRNNHEEAPIFLVTHKFLEACFLKFYDRFLLTLALKDDGHNKSVDTEDTSHNNWDEGLEDQVASEHTHAADTDAGLSGTVSSSKVGEDEGRSQAHEAEEGVLVGVVVTYKSTQRITLRSLLQRKRGMRRV